MPRRHSQGYQMLWVSQKMNKHDLQNQGCFVPEHSWLIYVGGHSWVLIIDGNISEPASICAAVYAVKVMNSEPYEIS